MIPLVPESGRGAGVRTPNATAAGWYAEKSHENQGSQRPAGCCRHA